MITRIFLYTAYEVTVLFSDILKELRNDHRHTQADLAALLGVAKSTVSNWEQNKNEPSFEMLCKICDLYDATADYMLGRTSDDPLLRKKRINQLNEDNQRSVKKFESFLLYEQQKETKK